MQNWNDLIYCLALAEHKTISGAAKALRSNPTTVSRHVQNVSEAYKRSIFVKNGQQWQPTDFGEKLVDIAKTVKTNIEAVQAETPMTASGKIRIYCDLLVMQTYQSFNWNTLLAENPSVDLELSANPSSLAFGEVDISFTSLMPTEGRIIRKKIAETQLAVYCAKTYVDNLTGWVALTEQVGHRPDESFLKDYFEAGPRMSVQCFELAQQIVRELPYMALLPCSVADQQKELCIVSNSPSQSVSIWASYHESRRNDPLIRNFFKHLEQSRPAT
ncbi:LysR family transcriptional regulator [Planktotalea sp.]|uniref:LysR family transcriptional regulator n=1 Tax=Planktotalea sp. TaxID=2029877 RepID=UPI003298D595